MTNPRSPNYWDAIQEAQRLAQEREQQQSQQTQQPQNQQTSGFDPYAPGGVIPPPPEPTTPTQPTTPTTPTTPTPSISDVENPENIERMQQQYEQEQKDKQGIVAPQETTTKGGMTQEQQKEYDKAVAGITEAKTLVQPTPDTKPVYSPDGQKVTINGVEYGIDKPLAGDYRYYDSASGGLVAGVYVPVELGEGMNLTSNATNELVAEIVKRTGASYDDVAALLKVYVNNPELAIMEWEFGAPSDDVIKARTLVNRHPELIRLLGDRVPGDVWKDFKNGIPFVATQEKTTADGKYTGEYEQSVVLLSFDEAQKLGALSPSAQFYALRDKGIYPISWEFLSYKDTNGNDVGTIWQRTRANEIAGTQLSRLGIITAKGELDKQKLIETNIDYEVLEQAGVGLSRDNYYRIKLEPVYADYTFIGEDGKEYYDFGAIHEATMRGELSPADNNLMFGKEYFEAIIEANKLVQQKLEDSAKEFEDTVIPKLPEDLQKEYSDSKESGDITKFQASFESYVDEQNRKYQEYLNAKKVLEDGGYEIKEDYYGVKPATPITPEQISNIDWSTVREIPKQYDIVKYLKDNTENYKLKPEAIAVTYALYDEDTAKKITDAVRDNLNAESALYDKVLSGNLTDAEKNILRTKIYTLGLAENVNLQLKVFGKLEDDRERITYNGTEYNDFQSYIDKLPEEDRNKLLDSVINDPNSSSTFASLVEQFNTAKQSLGSIRAQYATIFPAAMPGGMLFLSGEAVANVTAPLTVSNLAIAKQIDANYNHFLEDSDITFEQESYLKKALENNKIDVGDKPLETFRNLPKESQEEVIQDYTRSELGLSPSAWEKVQAGMMVLATILSKVPINKFIGKWGSMAIHAPITGVFIAGSMPTILSPSVKWDDRLVAILFDLMMINGMVTGITAKTTPKTETKVPEVETKPVDTVQEIPISTSAKVKLELYKDNYELGKVLRDIKEAPGKATDATIKFVKDKLVDIDITLNNIKQTFRELPYNTTKLIEQTKTLLRDIGSNVGKISDDALRDLNSKMREISNAVKTLQSERGEGLEISGVDWNKIGESLKSGANKLKDITIGKSGKFIHDSLVDVDIALNKLEQFGRQLPYEIGVDVAEVKALVRDMQKNADNVTHDAIKVLTAKYNNVIDKIKVLSQEKGGWLEISGVDWGKVGESIKSGATTLKDITISKPKQYILDRLVDLDIALNKLDQFKRQLPYELGVRVAEVKALVRDMQKNADNVTQDAIKALTDRYNQIAESVKVLSQEKGGGLELSGVDWNKVGESLKSGANSLKEITINKPKQFIHDRLVDLDIALNKLDKFKRQLPYELGVRVAEVKALVRDMRENVNNIKQESIDLLKKNYDQLIENTNELKYGVRGRYYDALKELESNLSEISSGFSDGISGKPRAEHWVEYAKVYNYIPIINNIKYVAKENKLDDEVKILDDILDKAESELLLLQPPKERGITQEEFNKGKEKALEQQEALQRAIDESRQARIEAERAEQIKAGKEISWEEFNKAREKAIEQQNALQRALDEAINERIKAEVEADIKSGKVVTWEEFNKARDRAIAEQNALQRALDEAREARIKAETTNDALSWEEFNRGKEKALEQQRALDNAYEQAKRTRMELEELQRAKSGDYLSQEQFETARAKAIAQEKALSDVVNELRQKRLELEETLAIKEGRAISWEDFNRAKEKAIEQEKALQKAIDDLKEQKRIREETETTPEKTDIDKLIDEQDKALSNEQTVLDSAKRIREKIENPETKKTLDKHIEELEKSIDRGKERKKVLVKEKENPTLRPEWERILEESKKREQGEFAIEKVEKEKSLTTKKETLPDRVEKTETTPKAIPETKKETEEKPEVKEALEPETQTQTELEKIVPKPDIGIGIELTDKESIEGIPIKPPSPETKELEFPNRTISPTTGEEPIVGKAQILEPSEGTKIGLEPESETELQPAIKSGYVTKEGTEFKEKIKEETKIIPGEFVEPLNKIKEKETTKPPVKGIISAKDRNGNEVQLSVPEGSAVWIQGRPMFKGGTYAPMLKILVPPYGDDDLYSSREIPEGYRDEGYKGKGSARKSLQIIGGELTSPAENVDLGWARINIRIKDGKPVIEYVQDEDANTGERSQTIGQGEGQIPIEVWREAKKQGISKEELISNPEKVAEIEQSQADEKLLSPKGIEDGTDYESLYNELVNKANEIGYEVKMVGHDRLKDYSAMNPHFAKTIGIQMSDNEILINEEWNKDFGTRYQTLRHELEELDDLQSGKPYWEAHNEALATEAQTDLSNIEMPKPIKRVTRITKPKNFKNWYDSPVYDNVEPTANVVKSKQRKIDKSNYYLGHKILSPDIGGDV